MLQGVGVEHCMMGPDTSGSHLLDHAEVKGYMDDPGVGGHPDLHQREQSVCARARAESVKIY